MTQVNIEKPGENQEQPALRKVRNVKKKPTVPPALNMSGDIADPSKLAKTREHLTDESEVEATPLGQEVTELSRERVQDQAKKVAVPGSNLDRLNYSIPYETLCGDKVEGIPAKLSYKPIDGFCVTKLNELNVDTIDEGLNTILDKLCYESRYEGFTHWTMGIDEKIRSYLNLRLNSVGSQIEHLMGICGQCGEEKLFTKVEITKFDELDLKEEYREPFPLKLEIDDKEVKFKTRLLQSGDIFKAKSIYAKNKDFVYTMFPDAVESDEATVVQIMEYANSIIEINGRPVEFEDAVAFCRDNVKVMNAMSGFNDYFAYGMVLEAESACNNEECPSRTKVDDKFDKETQKKVKTRRSQFRFPIQPSLFYIAYTEEENVKQYFDF